MRARGLISVLLWLAALPAMAQVETPYFSISSNKTYAAGEKPSVQMWAQHVETLEFRVYRVNDPVLFFQKLEDVHRFGGRGPALPRQRTWLERLHLFKRELRNTVRDFLRAQFDAASRARIRMWEAERHRQPVSGAQSYAQVPLLNPQQVVSVFRQKVVPGERWESQTVPIQVPGKGLYLVEATDGSLRAYTIVLVTEMAMVTKTSPGHVLAYVVNRQSGNPVKDCALAVWAGHKEAATSATGPDGVAEARFQAGRGEDVLVLGRAGDDFAVSSLYSWFLSTDPDNYWLAYIYTDRPVYRPGHTVYFKAILRNQMGAEYRLPAVSEVEAAINDPEGNTVFRKKLPLDPDGTLHGEFAIPANAALGYYAVVLRPGGENFLSGGFHVEEYKKPEYEVRVTPERRRVLEGEVIATTIEARYFFGEPVSGAKVTWVVHRSRDWRYAWGGEESEGEEEDSGEEGGYYYGGEQVQEQSGQFDPDGKLTIRVPTQVSDRKWDMRYRIEARVTDASNRETAGATTVLATYGSFHVDVRSDKYFYSPGETAHFTLSAFDYGEHPVPTAVTLELLRRERNNREVPVARYPAQTSATGEVRVDAPVSGYGSLIARVSAVTPEKREVEATEWLWVEGGAAEAWYWPGRQRVQIIPDKKSYRPGETARVLIVTGVPEAHLLVTTEGRELQSHQVVEARGPTAQVEIPVRADNVPNFYVSAVFVRGNQLYEGSKSLSVPPIERQLTVEVQSDKPQYRPGEAAKFTLSARDASGNPVSAELSLGIVDEAIYSIRPEAAQDIVKFFYGRAYNRVNTDSSLSYYFHGEAGKRKMQLTQLRPSTSLAQLKPERLVQPQVRKAFPDTMLWLPAVTTDANGRAVVQTTLPDALTTWRATARALTRDTRVGSAVFKTLVRKNLILRLATPRFLRQGDEVTVSEIVHNYLASQKMARVSLSVDGLQVLAGTTRDIAIPSRGEVKVDWRLRAGQVQDVKLLGKALTDEESDALEITLPVVPYGVKLASSKSGAIAPPTGEEQAELVFPQQAVDSTRSLQLSLTPSIAGAIFGALDFLTSYPYGCTEQTMSSFLPDIVVARAMKELGQKFDVNQAELDKKVREGLDRLYDFQHQDGGWGWWKTDDSHLFMTAYVLAGLAQAKQAGYAISEPPLEKARQWLKAELEREPRLDPDLRAYVAYALAQYSPGDAATLNPVWEQRGKLSSYGLALLGLALDAAGDARANDLAAQLESKTTLTGAMAHWPLDHNPLMGYESDSSAEATAYALKLLARKRPQSPLLSQAALWLVSHRNQGYYWDSTEQTAMVVYGLTDYLKLSGELKPNFTAEVWVNDKKVATQRFTPANALSFNPNTLRIAAKDLAAGANRVRVRKSGEGRLYWSARAEFFSTEEKYQRTGKVALNLLRDYFRLAPERDGERIVYRLAPLTGPLAPGDVVAVRLTVSGGEWRYLMIEDPIPAGAEFIERDDLYEIKDRPNWWGFWFTRREFHDDRAAIFQTWFGKGQQQYLYLLKIVNPGSFRVSPARVEPMYQPEYLSTSEGRTVEVK